MDFTENLKNIITTSVKENLTRYLKQHFKERIDYIIIKPSIKHINGRPNIDYFLTKNAFELIQNSFKMRQIDLGKK